MTPFQEYYSKLTEVEKKIAQKNYSLRGTFHYLNLKEELL